MASEPPAPLASHRTPWPVAPSTHRFPRLACDFVGGVIWVLEKAPGEKRLQRRVEEPVSSLTAARRGPQGSVPLRAGLALRVSKVSVSET